jgi:hypothetical protein
MINKLFFGVIGFILVISIITVNYIKSIKHALNNCTTKNNSLDIALNAQNVTIRNWKNESDLAQKKINESSLAAKNKYEQIKQEEKIILETNVPKECNAAIKWSIEQAKEMRP